jgi:hypothetical protein
MLQRLAIKGDFEPLCGALLLKLAHLPALLHLEAECRELDKERAVELVSTAGLKRLVLTVNDHYRAGMEDACAVLRAAPGLDFRCCFR